MCEPRLDQEDEESAPLLSNTSDREDGSHDCNKCSKWSLFYFFCFLSGQYINVDVTKPFKKVTCISVAGLILFGLQFLLYLGHVGTAVAVEYCRIRNISDPINTTNGTINCTLPDVYWKFSTAVTVGTFAAFLSYAFFTIIILMPVNGFCLYCCERVKDCGICLCCCKCEDSCNSDCVFSNACSDAHRNAFKNGALSPFNDSDESSKLSATETRCFFFNYIIVFIMYVCSFGTSIVFAIFVYYKSR